jgi:carnitine 3-dehydrogenase
VIGASWAAYFLAQGPDVSATDPMPDAQEKLLAAVFHHWSSLLVVAGLCWRIPNVQYCN